MPTLGLLLEQDGLARTRGLSPQTASLLVAGNGNFTDWCPDPGLLGNLSESVQRYVCDVGHIDTSLFHSSVQIWMPTSRGGSSAARGEPAPDGIHFQCTIRVHHVVFGCLGARTPSEPPSPSQVLEVTTGH